ncbi:14801_t:CDS:2, partial [Acaulospora colombiana]
EKKDELLLEDQHIKIIEDQEVSDRGLLRLTEEKLKQDGSRRKSAEAIAELLWTHQCPSLLYVFGVDDNTVAKIVNRPDILTNEIKALEKFRRVSGVIHLDKSSNIPMLLRPRAVMTFKKSQISASELAKIVDPFRLFHEGGKGYAQYVTTNERMDKKVSGMLRNAVRPPIKDYNIIWTESELEHEGSNEKEGEIMSEINPPDNNLISSQVAFVEAQIKQAPFVIPQIYSGIRFIVYCILSKGVRPKREITLTAKSSDGPVSLIVPLDPVTLQGSKIHTLAARKLIQDLNDGAPFIHKHPKNESKPIPVSVIEEQIVNLGTTFNLASKYTSFLAIDERDNRPIGKLYPPEERSVPLQLSRGRNCLSLGGAKRYRKILTEDIVHEESVACDYDDSYDYELNFEESTIDVELNFKESKIEVLYEFLNLQSFDGKFNPTPQFYKCFDRKEFKDFKEIDIDNEEILCTALAIGYLEVIMFRQFKDECEMCWEKANKALRKLVDDEKAVKVLEKTRNWVSKWTEA